MTVWAEASDHEATTKTSSVNRNMTVIEIKRDGSTGDSPSLVQTQRRVFASCAVDGQSRQAGSVRWRGPSALMEGCDSAMDASCDRL